MIYILDGYNVIYALPEFERHLDASLEAARNALIARCAETQARRGDVDHVYLVFDGAVQGRGSVDRSVAGVTVMFSRRGEEADDRILRLIKEDVGRRPVTVVSRDNYVWNNAKANAVRVMSPQTFFATIRTTSRRRGASSRAGDEDRMSAGDAKAITDMYRRHLESQAGDE